MKVRFTKGLEVDITFGTSSRRSTPCCCLEGWYTTGRKITVKNNLMLSKYIYIYILYILRLLWGTRVDVSSISSNLLSVFWKSQIGIIA